MRGHWRLSPAVVRYVQSYKAQLENVKKFFAADMESQLQEEDSNK
jgi:hypothetical protein